MGSTRSPGDSRAILGGHSHRHVPLTCAQLGAVELNNHLDTTLTDFTKRLQESADDLQSAGRELARVAVELFAESAIVWLVGPDDRTLEPIGSHDYEPLRDQQLSRLLSGARPHVGEGLIGTTIANDQLKIINEASPELTEGFAPYVEFCRRSNVTSILISPISSHGQVIGAFALLRRAEFPNFDHRLDTTLTRFSEAVADHFGWACARAEPATV